MAIQFPSNPTNNQTFTANGLQYTFNSTYGVWRAASTSSGGGGVTTYTNITDLPLTGNTTGEQAFVGENNRLYIWSGTGWYNIALVNTSPTAITGANGNYAFATDGTPIVLTLVSTDPEGLPLTWSYSVTSGSLENGGGTTATISQSANVFTITPTTNEDYVGTFSLTFTASDGVNLATATSLFSLQFAILNSKYTSLMLKTSGTNAQQNNTFIDSSTNNFTITSTGNTTQGTFSPYGDKWSNYFDGSGDYLTINGSIISPVAAASSRYTIEVWVYPIETNQTLWHIYSSAGDNYTLDALIQSATQVRFRHIDGSAGGNQQSIDVSGLVFNSWNYVALEKTATSTFSLQVNSTTTTWSPTNLTYSSTSGRIVIGANTYNGGVYNQLKGYISELRIVNDNLGIGSIPTEPLTAIAGTSLLTCQSNRFKDNSTNNFAITKSGDVKVQRFSPFDIESYNPEVIGGSAYFDGSGSTQLSLGSLQNSWNQTGDWTMEFWIMPSSLANGWIFRQASTAGTLAVWTYASNNIRLSVYSGPNIDSTALNVGSWHHVAVVNNGTTDVITLYVNGVAQGSASSAGMGNYTTHYLGGTQDGVNSPIGYISDFRIVNSIIYTGNFTPPTAPLLAITNTALLLNMTNAGIYDTSGNNDIETVGNAQVSTAVTKYGSSSMYFDGTGDYLSTPTNQNLVFGTGDFTVEFWIYLLANTSGYTKYFGTGNGGGCFTIETQGATNVLTITDYAASVFLTSSTALTLNTWTHVTASRNGTSLKLFINGVQTGSATNSTNFVGSVAYVGGNGQSYINAYISDLRITKGLARYTANFTPPTSELLG